ncbi:hypothetical protein Tco_0163012, partial [Tanacetum coccineum]
MIYYMFAVMVQEVWFKACGLVAVIQEPWFKGCGSEFEGYVGFIQHPTSATMNETLTERVWIGVSTVDTFSANGSVDELEAEMLQGQNLWLLSEIARALLSLDGTSRIYQLANEIVELKQSNCTIEVYYHKLKGLWDEIDAIEAPYACSCKCTCENGKENGEREQRKRLIQFLMGLDECYINIRGQILLMQPLPLVAKAYSMLRQEEKQMIIKGAHIRKGVFCGYCKKEGHPKGECYKLLGYPPGHPLRTPSQRSSQTNKGQRSVNMMTRDTSLETPLQPMVFPDQCSTSAAPEVTESQVHARMDQLQNQLNEVLLMMQNHYTLAEASSSTAPHVAGILSFSDHIILPTKVTGIHSFNSAAKMYSFIASHMTKPKSHFIWVVDSGATDH